MCPLESLEMDAKLPENWERADNDLGVPYYVDHKDKLTHWDHPLFCKVTEQLSSCDSIKYSAYRTAAKIRTLQKLLHFDHVRLNVVAGVFEQHGLSADENTSSVECGHLEAILSDIFFVAKTEIQALNGKQFDQHIATELALNLILNTFDQKRRGSVKVIDVKVLMAILSCGLTDPAIFVQIPKGREKWAQNRLMECYRFLFFQAIEGNGGVAVRSRLSSLFHAVSTFIGIFLKEWRGFGLQFVPGTLYSCMELASEEGVSEEDFLKWLESGPRLFVWLTTLHRMMAAESVRHHGVRCVLCKSSPIVGLRFRCLSCLMHDQCQECFLHGKTNGKHKLGHPMYEYCLPTTSREDREALVKTLKNKVKSSRFRIIQPRNKHDGSIWERRSVTYVDNEQIEGAKCNTEDCVGETQLLLRELELTSGGNEVGRNGECISESIDVMPAPLPPRYPKEELSSIIGHLEEGHRDLGEHIEGLWLRQDRGVRGGGNAAGLLGMLCLKGAGDWGDSGSEELMCQQLQGTRVQLEEQVKRLKALQECLQKIQPSFGTARGSYVRQCHLESTPMPMNIRAHSAARPLPRLDDLSPILAQKPSIKSPEAQASSEESVGVILSNLNGGSYSPSNADLEVENRFSSSPSLSVLTEVSPQDLSTILMARWRGGMKGFVGSTQVSSPTFPASSILGSPTHPCHMYQKNGSKRRAEIEDEPSVLGEIQKDLDWVLDELDAMLISQVSDQSSSGESGSSHHGDPGEMMDNQKLCRAATQLEDLLAGLIQVVERQKKTEIETSSSEVLKM
ncbi:dystrophin-like [Ischnura elegans]|uniref:dystrophin-like n=1 Tax=Ischnura elegans TaxID=197161 RepID=UPI001ED875C3|nr:dystrophin-like [Ischnura elegans]